MLSGQARHIRKHTWQAQGLFELLDEPTEGIDLTLELVDLPLDFGDVGQSPLGFRGDRPRVPGTRHTCSQNSGAVANLDGLGLDVVRAF